MVSGDVASRLTPGVPSGEVSGVDRYSAKLLVVLAAPGKEEIQIAGSPSGGQIGSISIERRKLPQK